jgi:hypothetical protein
MKKQTTYYIIGAVLVGVGIYLYFSKKDNQKSVVVNLNPPMEVNEDKDEVVTKNTTETTVFTTLDKLKALIDSIKTKGTSTPPIQG